MIRPYNLANSKSIIECILLGQTIGVVPAAEFQLTPFKNITTYLNIPDCQGKESLFQAEMNRCHQQLEMLENAEKQKEFRREHVQTTLILKKYLDKHSRLMHIYYGSDGYESMSFRYHLSPYLSDNFNFSVGPKKNSQDLWSADYSVEELITYLNSDDLYVERRKFFEKRSIDPSFLLLKKNYTHIYVENAHYNFYEKFKKIFINFDEIDKKNKNFFLIIRENNLLYLKLLDRVK